MSGQCFKWGYGKKKKKTYADVLEELDEDRIAVALTDGDVLVGLGEGELAVHVGLGRADVVALLEVGVSRGRGDDLGEDLVDYGVGSDGRVDAA